MLSNVCINEGGKKLRQAIRFKAKIFTITIDFIVVVTMTMAMIKIMTMIMDVIVFVIMTTFLFILTAIISSGYHEVTS